MKKLLIAFALMSLSSQLLAQGGIYDGIWQGSNGDFATVRQNGDSLVVILLDSSLLQWDAYQGILTGTRSVVSTVASFGIATLQLDFTSTETAVVTIVSCTPTELATCLFPNGTQFNAVRIF